MTSPWCVLSEPLAPPFDPQRAAEAPILAAIGADLHEVSSPEAWAVAMPSADAVLHWRVPMGAEEIARLNRCRIIAHYGVGVDRIDVAAAAAAGIYVTNVPRYGVDEVADHALTLLLACARKLHALEGIVRDGAWGVQSVRPIGRLRGRTLGIIGLGNIGSAVAARALTFGLDVIACDPYVDSDKFARVGARPCDVTTLLSSSDYISLHVPLTGETRGLIDAAAFSRMKQGVIVVNTSRGAVIDEPALLRALADGVVAAAGLDVFAQEPLPMDSPLRADTRIILTPHAAFFSEESIIDMQAGACRQVVEALAGRRPTSLAALPGIGWQRADERWRRDA
jgi:D-3-phosphoglycerate dehydrogenase